MSTFLIRRILPEDQSEVKGIVIEGLGEHFGFIDETKNLDLNDIVKNYSQMNGEFFVGTLDESIICTGALIPEDDNLGRVVRMSTLKSQRRKGYGANMLSHLVEHSKSIGNKGVLISTQREWRGVIAFYENFGFEVCAEDDIDVHMVLRF